MAFRSQMHDGIGLMLPKNPLDFRSIADIDFFKNGTFAVDDLRQRVGVGGIGQCVEANDRRVGFGEQITAHRRPDETCCTGDNNFHRCSSIPDKWLPPENGSAGAIRR